MIQRWVKASQIVVVEGDAGDHAFTVVEGVIKVFKSLADGRVQNTGFLLPGDFLGMPSHGTYGCSAEAVKPSGLSVSSGVAPCQRIGGMQR